jgi:hypothetical protein
MKVIEDKEGYLILSGELEDQAEAAFEDGRLVEAFALLHAGIDWWMTDLYQLYRIFAGTDKGQGWAEFADGRRVKFIANAEFLRDVGLISQDQFRSLDRFDKLRNKVVHRLVFRTYQARNNNRLRMSDVRTGFYDGIALINALRGKTGDLGLEAIFKRGAERAAKASKGA